MDIRRSATVGAALLVLGTLCARPAAAQQAQAPLFREGECSGVLCSTIGGSQAPQNQPRKSLFPEGQCGGVLCSAIGGSQAPQHAEPPPPCGGGILCDMAPYAMGQPFVRPQPVAVAPPPAPVAEPAPRRKAKARKRSAAAN